VKWALTPDVKLVFVCIGANDGLRGTPLRETKANVDALLRELKKDGRAVVLAGIKIPPNYGKPYADGFAALFPELARAHRVPLLPFLLEGVAADPALNLPDGIHPNADGQKVIAKTVLAFLDKEGLPR
jgi:acyl-CoA thioesterase-1